MKRGLLLVLLGGMILSAQTAFHQVTITWAPGAGGDPPTSFGVLRGTTSGGESSTPIGTVPFVSGQTSYTYTDVGSATNVLTGGATYYYEIEAINTGGTTVGPEKSVTIPFFAPAAPSAPTLTAK
jgi:hypothetical protein